MPQFSLKDAIVPEIFAPYVQNLSTKTNRFITSGITTSNFDISAQLTQPGTEIQMPFKVANKIRWSVLVQYAPKRCAIVS